MLLERDLLPPSTVSVYATGSVVRGWAHANSDIDLYVVTTEQWSGVTAERLPVALLPNSVASESFVADGWHWEAEYWLDTQVDQVIAKLADGGPARPGLITAVERDLLERLLQAVPLANDDWVDRRRRQVRDSPFVPMLVGHALRNAATFVDDAVGMLGSSDTASAVLAARLAFTHSVDALLTYHGVIARSSKWHFRRFCEVGDVPVLSRDDYWAVETMRDFRPEDPVPWTRGVLRRCAEIAAALDVDGTERR